MQKHLGRGQPQSTGVRKHAGRPFVGRPHAVPVHGANPTNDSEEEECGHRQKGRERCDESSGQHLRGADVDQLAQALVSNAHHILTYSVEHDDGVIDRVPHDGQKGRDRREIHFLLQKHVDAERDERVVEHGDDATGSESQIEAERDVQHDERDGVQQRLNRRVAELLARLRTDPLDAKRVVRSALAEPLAKLA